MTSMDRISLIGRESMHSPWRRRSFAIARGETGLHPCDS
jgi:hypothetical protein